MKIASRTAYLPSPGDDTMYSFRFIDQANYFGSPSIYALKHWVCLRPTFEKNIKQIQQLDQLGFVLKEYLVEEESIEFGHSGLQLAFDRNYCIEQGMEQTRSILELINHRPGILCLRGGKIRLRLPHVFGKDDLVWVE